MINQEPTSRMHKFLTTFVALDRRWIFSAVAIVTIVFMMLEFKLPIQPSPQARGMYATINAVQPGDVVHFSIDYGPSSAAELWPQHLCILRDLMRRGARVVCSSLWVDGPPTIEKGFNMVVAELEKEGIHRKRGVDYVNLGYKAGDRVAIASLGASFKQTFPTDYSGRPTASLPIMQGWDNYHDVALLITIGVGDPGAVEYVQQAQSRYRVTMVAGVTAVISPQLYPYFQAGNLQGFLGGLAGAAEYEKLADTPGRATKGMNVQSAIHVLIVLLVLLGSLAQFALRWTARR